MGNWFQNALSSVNDVGTTLASGIQSQIGGVLGGVVGGVTQAVGGGTGVVGNPSIGVTGNYGNQGAFSQGGIGTIMQGGAGLNVGAFGVQTGLNNQPTSSGNLNTSGTTAKFMDEIVDPATGQPYDGIWKYWNKPSNIRFYLIWLLGGLTIFAILYMIFGGKKTMPRKKKRVSKTTNRRI